MTNGQFNGEDRILLRDIDRKVASVQTELEGIQGRLERNDENFVTKDAFMPVARIAYGLAGSILTSVIGAILWLLLKT